jgi:hypothetical protein
MQKFKLVKFSKDFYRIMDTAADKMAVGVTILPNGQWQQIKFEAGTEKKFGRKFDTPEQAFEYFKEKAPA